MAVCGSRAVATVAGGDGWRVSVDGEFVEPGESARHALSGDHLDGGKRSRQCWRGRLACVLVASHAAFAAVTLPVEVVGKNGSSTSVSMDLPAGAARDVKALRMRIHNLTYADMVSVQVN